MKLCIVLTFFLRLLLEWSVPEAIYNLNLYTYRQISSYTYVYMSAHADACTA